MLLKSEKKTEPSKYALKLNNKNLG